MRSAYRVADVRAAEAALLARVPEGMPMQRAAAGLAARCASILGTVYGSRVTLLVGSGNNGGDALYAGQRLARRGARVSALLLGTAHRAGLAAFRAAGGRVVTAVPDADLVVDGIVGIGGHPGLRPDALAAVRDAAATGAPVVAVDVPSGIDVDTGAAPDESVRADVTVTFGWLKPGLVVGPAADRAGLVELVDIGALPAEQPAEPALLVPDAPDVAGWWPRPAADSDKYRRGVVGVAAGSGAYPGAGVLSVAGALAGPTGFVRYAGRAVDHVRRDWPEVVLAEAVAGAGRVNGWVVGPGLSRDEHAAGELRAVLDSDVPVCVDADGLNLLSERPELVARRTAATVLTPHDREFARLAGAEPGADRAAAARSLADRLGAVVLLKGDRTVVAEPGGVCYVNSTGTPALATAGSGDVLSGILGSLLAAGLPAARAAIAAAFVHGLAARHAAAGGPVTARHVAAALRPAVRDLLRRP